MNRTITPMRTLIVVMLFATIVSWTYASVHTPRTFEELAVVADAAASEKCGISIDELRAAPPNAAAVCSEWGTEAFLYSLRYPAAAPALYGLYGKLPEWHTILEKYGHPVIPVVWAYFEQGSMVQQVEHDVGLAVSSILKGQMPTFASEKLTPIEQGALAIYHINEDGHDVLARFARDGEEAETKPIIYTLRFVEDLLIGGVKAVEEKLVLGQDVTMKEYGLAALDVALLAVAGNAIISGIKHSGAAATTKALTAKGLATTGVKAKFAVLKAASIGAGKTVWVIGKKVLPAAAVVGVGYVVVRHPMLPAAAIAWTFKEFGMSPALAYTLAWVIIAIIVWAIVWFLTWPIRTIYRGARMLARI